MSIREYAKKIGYPIVGELRQHKIMNGIKLHRIYIDEAGSEFWISKQGEITIVTPDGGVL